MSHLTPMALATALACSALASHGQPATAPPPAASASAASASATSATPIDTTPITTLPAVTIRASADASAQGLTPAFPGGQVARGGRAGILGTQDHLDTPFSITSYTHELIQDRHARSVGEVLQNDATVRTARGFGNFQEAYFIRGFILGSDDVAYNGLYGLLPRQYIATELFERVEVLRGASAFLNGASPNGGGIGGAINLLPKRAPNEPLTQFALSGANQGAYTMSTDIARRFGPDQATGVRLNAALRDGETSIDNEKSKLGLLSVGVDWRSRNVRLSGDLGHQDNRLKQARPNVALVGVIAVPDAPDASANFAQPWSYSNERDLFGTLRGEFDVNEDITAWAAYGLRRSDEANSLANLDVNNAATGAATTYRFDNTRKDQVDTGELGLRGTLRTGAVEHAWVASFSAFKLEKENAYRMDPFNTLATNLYAPSAHPQPAFRPPYDFVTNPTGSFMGGDLGTPGLTGITRLTSHALGDTLSLLDKQLLVTLGVRHQKLDVADFAYGTAAPLARYTKNRTSPMLGVVYKLTSPLSVYGNYIEGLTQGQTAPTTVTPGFPTPPLNAGLPLDPYVSKQKEIGIKYEPGRIGGSVALFSVEKPRAYVNASNVFTDEGSDKHSGLELNAYGEAMRGLKVLGGATWLDAKQKNTGSATTDGKRVIGVARLQASLGLEWNVPTLQGLALDARLVHTGASYADAANTLRVPGWTRIDVGARYLADVLDHAVTLRARIDNLADKDHWSSVGGYPDAGYLVAGRPRTVSLSASIDF